MQKILVYIVFISACFGSYSYSQTSDLTGEGTASIEFISIPKFGSTADLAGKVHNINPLNYKVAVYIYVEGAGWWTKPTFNFPLTSIKADSSWLCDITTGDGDIYAIEIAAFLLPNGISAPSADGLALLPAELYNISSAFIKTLRYGKSLSFSGYDWWLKASNTPVGPGPNYFTDDTANVWVDKLGYLHLKITNKNGSWVCPEIVSQKSFGMGKYTFSFISNVGNLDRNTVLGLFTWDNDSAQTHREIDIEFSQWGVLGNQNSQYVIQPWDVSANMHRWQFPLNASPSVHSFLWMADSIRFESNWSGVLNHQWTYRGSYNPGHGNENVRLNLWLMNGNAPIDISLLEVIVQKFEFMALATDVDNKSALAISSSPELYQNYPNPFNPSTRIEYFLPSDCAVNLTVNSILGKLVERVFVGYQKRGNHSVEFNSKNLPSGFYIYTLTSDTFIKNKKMVVIK